MDTLMRCPSPLGEITLAADGDALCGLWFAGQRHFAGGLSPFAREGTLPVLEQAAAWLALYFAGREPDFTPPLRARGTAFQRAVWAALTEIPYGATLRYADIAERIGRPGAARAVGGAAGRNPIALIVPCHRVLGAGGALTGYAGGLERKRALLRLERGEPEALAAYKKQSS